MLVLPDYAKPYMIDSLSSPVVIKHNWMFNATIVDFVLSPITYLEETQGPAVKLRINNADFWVPSSWKILVTDNETYQLDTVNIQSCANTNHLAFAFSPSEMKLRTFDIMVTDYSEHMNLTHPMINKGYAMIHPCGLVQQFNKPDFVTSVIIGPHDLYKHIGDKVVGDLFTN